MTERRDTPDEVVSTVWYTLRQLTRDALGFAPRGLVHDVITSPLKLAKLCEEHGAPDGGYTSDEVFEALLRLHTDGRVESLPGGGYRLHADLFEGEVSTGAPAPDTTKQRGTMAARKKGREKRAGTTDEGTGLVRVKLDGEQWKGRCDDLASAIKKREDVMSKKNAAVEKYNGELKLLETQISQLADEVDTHEANVDAQQAMNFTPVGGGHREGVAANDASEATA